MAAHIPVRRGTGGTGTLKQSSSRVNLPKPLPASREGKRREAKVGGWGLGSRVVEDADRETS